MASFHAGDLVSVLHFDLAKVRRHRKRGGVSNRGRVHIEYADGTTYRVQQSELRLISRCGDENAAITHASCPICGTNNFLLSSCCGHAACLVCWISWANGIADTFHGSPATLRCWSYLCEDVINAKLWETLEMHGHYHGEDLRILLRRRRLQMNVLFPPSVQVDCRNPGCPGLGYLGSETVMCFFCEDQWVPSDDASQCPIGMGTDELEHLACIKRCPKCHVLIAKNGGCDHMTCRCRYEFWWTTLLPYP